MSSSPITVVADQAVDYALRDEIMAYLAIFPVDTADLQPLLRQLDRNEELFNRRNFTGHITGAGIVLSPDGRSVLMVHHKLYDRWQQPGGHAEAGDGTPLTAAWREVMEETDVRVLGMMPVQSASIPIRIAVHSVPANPFKSEPQHYHYDFQYVFTVADETLRPQVSEVSGAAWVELDDPRVVHIAEAVNRIKSHILSS